MYILEPTKNFLADVTKHKKSGNKKLLTKIDSLIVEIAEHPREGTGQVERLKHYGEREVYSRRINKEHRLVYEIEEEKILILLLSAYGHY